MHTKLRNVLTTIGNLKPGDTWQYFNEGAVHVVYEVTPSTENKFDTVVEFVRVDSDGSYTKGSFTMSSHTPFVADRPE